MAKKGRKLKDGNKNGLFQTENVLFQRKLVKSLSFWAEIVDKLANGIENKWGFWAKKKIKFRRELLKNLIFQAEIGKLWPKNMQK